MCSEQGRRDLDATHDESATNFSLGSWLRENGVENVGRGKESGWRPLRGRVLRCALLRSAAPLRGYSSPGEVVGQDGQRHLGCNLLRIPPKKQTLVRLAGQPSGAHPETVPAQQDDPSAQLMRPSAGGGENSHFSKHRSDERLLMAGGQYAAISEGTSHLSVSGPLHPHPRRRTATNRPDGPRATCPCRSS